MGCLGSGSLLFSRNIAFSVRAEYAIYMEYAHPPWEKNLARELEETLDSLPEAEGVTSQENADPGYDYLMEFKLGEQPVRLLVECKRAAYPRDVRELAGRWEKLAVSKNAVPMLAAESISSPLREE